MITERVHLLAHILSLIIKPSEEQHCDMRKLGLTVKKLEETTYEALSSFFMECDTNAKKRPYLAEIFKVARQEERYRSGELGEYITFFCRGLIALLGKSRVMSWSRAED